MKASISLCIRKFFHYETSNLNVLRTLQIRCCQQDSTTNYQTGTGGFINLVAATKNDQVEDFPLNIMGKILQKNLEAEWWKTLKATSDFKILKSELDIKVPVGSEQDLLLDQVLPHLNASGGALCVAKFSNGTTKELKRHLVIVFSKHFSSDQDIQHEQLRFIKNFFNNPGRIKVNSVLEGNGTTDHHEVIYKAEDIDFKLQEIIKYTQLRQSSATVLALNLHQMHLAVMNDAFRKRSGRVYLKLHHKLAPIKVVMFCEKTDRTEELNQLAQEICTMLRSINISCWNGATKGLTLSDADSLGAPFSVILPESVLNNGILFMRSLNTTVNMEVHVSLLAEKLLKYLEA